MHRDLYVYVIFRPNGIPCYVGKGRGDRWKVHAWRGQNKHLSSIYRLGGGALPILKVREDLTDREACETEIALIAAIGREINGGPLVNQTDGGDGTGGAIMTPEWRAHRSVKSKEAWSNPSYRAVLTAARIGNQNSKKPHVLSEEWRQTLTEKMRGNTHTLGLKHSDEARALMSAARKGVPKSEEHRAAIGAAHRGRKKTAEQCAAMSVSRKGKTMSDETRTKISATTKGRSKSPETRARMRAAQFERRSRERAQET